MFDECSLCEINTLKVRSHIKIRQYCESGKQTHTHSPPNTHTHTHTQVLYKEPLHAWQSSKLQVVTDVFSLSLYLSLSSFYLPSHSFYPFVYLSLSLISVPLLSLYSLSLSLYLSLSHTLSNSNTHTLLLTDSLSPSLSFSISL